MSGACARSARLHQASVDPAELQAKIDALTEGATSAMANREAPKDFGRRALPCARRRQAGRGRVRFVLAGGGVRWRAFLLTLAKLRDLPWAARVRPLYPVLVHGVTSLRGTPTGVVDLAGCWAPYSRVLRAGAARVQRAGPSMAPWRGEIAAPLGPAGGPARRAGVRRVRAKRASPVYFGSAYVDEQGMRWQGAHPAGNLRPGTPAFLSISA